MPKVSVVVPVYGVEKYIERTVRCLFEQTLTDIEFIFIDDCTPDSSIEILNRLIKEYKNLLDADSKSVRILRMSSNSGQAAVRRHGVQLATGDYIIHCDSDDWIDKDLYRTMYVAAVNANADIVICDYMITDGTNIDIYQKACYDTERNSFLEDMLLQKVSWAVWNKMVKKELYEGDIVYPTGNVGEDMLLSTILVCKSHIIAYVKSQLYYYFYNPASIMRQGDKNANLAKYLQLKANTDSLITYLSDKSYVDLNRIIPSLRMNQCLFLNKFISDKYVYELWKNDVGKYWRMLFDQKILGRYKLLYLLLRTKIYAFLLKIKII